MGMTIVQNSGKAHELSGIDTPARAVAILPRSSAVAGALDGRREGPFARQETRRILHTVPPGSGRVRLVEKDHPKTYRQYVAAWRGAYPRRERRASSEKSRRRTTCPNGDP